MRSAPPPEWLWPLFPVVFALLWVLSCALLGLLAGHLALLRRFPPLQEPLEERYGFASGRMRLVNFSNALHVGIGRRGLHLAPSWPFRPLFARGIPCIPWEQIRLVRAQPRSIFSLFRGTQLELPAARVRVAVFGRAGRAIEQRLAGAADGAEARRPMVRES